MARHRSLRVRRAERSTATVRNAYRIGRSMAGSSANVNDFLLGRDTGEGQVDELPKEWPEKPDVTRAIGDRWLHNGSTAMLRVPSVLSRRLFTCC